MERYLCSLVGRVLLKCHAMENISRFSAITIHIPMAFFIELEQTILTFVWNKAKYRQITNRVSLVAQW